MHDYLCDMQQYQRADAWLEQLLIDNSQIKRWHRIVVMCGVRLWHWLGYRQAGYYESAKPRWWLALWNSLYEQQ